MGGRGGSSGAGGKGGGGLGADIRRVYGRLVNPRGAGWVPISDIRDALPGVGHQQMTDALLNLARTDPRFKMATWDDQKVLTAKQRAAGIRYGGNIAHAVHIDPPGAR